MIKKVKDWLGIEGVKIKLTVPETFSLKEQVVTGEYLISTQSEQYIDDIKLILKEKYIRGRRKSKLIDEYVLVEKIIPINQSIDKEKDISQDFSLIFSQLKSPIDRFGDKNFLYRGITNLAKIFKNAKSEFSLTIEVKVRGNKLKPYDTVILVAN